MTEDKVFTCPKCGNQLIRTNIVHDKEVIIAYTCFTIECRKGLEAPVYYGNTQEDINNNIKPQDL